MVIKIPSSPSLVLFLFLAVLFCGSALVLSTDLTEQQKQSFFLQAKKAAITSSSAHKKKLTTHHSSSNHKRHYSSSTSSKKKKPQHSLHHTATTSHHSSQQVSSTSHHTSLQPSSTPPYSSHHSTVTSHSAIVPSSDTSHDQIIPINKSSVKGTPITIAKSGMLPDEGLSPPPLPEPVRPNGLSWLFGNHHSSSTSYRYLSPSVRRAIDRAWVRRGRWKYIIVHNSGTRSGNARAFDIYHRRVRHMVNGLAYHFVIGNGRTSGNGEIEIGHRWTAQINGGHVASDYLNDISLGICLVGDYNLDLPTKNQIGALNELISYLRARVGKAQGHQAIVCAHKEINPKPTDCPGKRFPYTWLHHTFRN